ncbi:MAG: hypothetical protein K4304_04450 [Propionicimonas sp.]
MSPPFVGGLPADADGLADGGPARSSPTGLNDRLGEVVFSLPQFRGRRAECSQRSVFSFVAHGDHCPR